MIDSGDEASLVTAAVEAARAAYAPYSRFQVGAAIMAPGGRIVAGCNVENASYGLTICAERVAVFTAVSQGLRDFGSLAICAAGGAAPCGACRQVLHEFSPGLLVLRCNLGGTVLGRHRLSDLLPHGFGASQLDSE
jgi:cytidine deaminase